jgi:hypothetical protein
VPTRSALGLPRFCELLPLLTEPATVAQQAEVPRARNLKVHNESRGRRLQVAGPEDAAVGDEQANRRHVRMLRLVVTSPNLTPKTACLHRHNTTRPEPGWLPRR